MRASALRGAIILAAIVVSAVIIANAFPESNGPKAVAKETQSPSPSPHRSPSPSPTPTKVACPARKGVRVAVENATSTAGLAAATATTLQSAGYTIDPQNDIGNAPSDQSTTTVYFHGSGNKTAATCLKKKFFKSAAVRPEPAGGISGVEPPISPLVQVAVFLGADYASSHPVG